MRLPCAVAGVTQTLIPFAQLQAGGSSTHYPPDELCPGRWEQGQEPRRGHGEPQAGGLPGARPCHGPEELAAELTSPAQEEEAPAMPLGCMAGAGQLGAHRSLRSSHVLAGPGLFGSGRTQLHPDQSSHEGPGHPSATTLHSRVLPRQICCLRSCLCSTAGLGGAQCLGRSKREKHLPSAVLEGFAGLAEPDLLPRQRLSVGHGSRAEAARAAPSLGRAEMLSRPNATLPRHSCPLWEFGEGGKRVAVRPKATLQPPPAALGEQLAHPPLLAGAAGSRAGAGPWLTQKPPQPGHRPGAEPHPHTTQPFP